MGLEVGTYVGDLDITNPVGATDKRHQGDDHIRLIKAILKATFPNASKPFRFPSILSKTSNYTILSSDSNAVIFADTSAGAFNLTLPSLAVGDAGWEIRIVKNTSDTNALTVVGTINGETNMSLNNRFETLDIIWSGTAWLGVVDQNGMRVAVITGDLTITEDYLDGIILSTPTGANKTISLPAVANYRGRMLTVHHTGNTYKTTLDGNLTETISGSTTYDLTTTNAYVTLVAMATGWVIISTSNNTVNATSAEVIAATDSSKVVTPSAMKPLGYRGANITSASTITVTDDGDFFHVTGTVTITDIDLTTDAPGREFTLIFDGALTLTHNATTLILPGGTNITTAAGDSGVFRSEGSDNIRCIAYTKADGTAVVGPSAGTAIEKTSDQTSNVTVDDNTLQFSVEANKNYVATFAVTIVMSNGTPVSCSMNITVPASPTRIYYSATCSDDLLNSLSVTSGGSITTTTSTSNTYTVHIRMLLKNGANAGTVKLRFGGSGSQTVKAGSWVEYHEVA